MSGLSVGGVDFELYEALIPEMINHDTYLVAVITSADEVVVPISKYTIRVYKSLQDLEYDLRAQYGLAHAATDDRWTPWGHIDLGTTAHFNGALDRPFSAPLSVMYETGWVLSSNITIIPVKKDVLTGFFSNTFKDKVTYVHT